MRLIVAEKPSVARAIASVLGIKTSREGYLEGERDLVSWCIGHLIELAPAHSYSDTYQKWKLDDLPILPKPWQYGIALGKEEQYKVLKTLMLDKRVREIICATDAGREGELIFRLVYDKTRCRKPVKRLWISSMEDKAIEAGLNKLRPAKDYDLLYESALCRAQADWLIGINATRIFSLLYKQTFNIGRVMSPTLAMVVDRWQRISNFKSQPFYTVILKLGDFEAVSDRYSDKEKAQAVFNTCLNKTALIKDIKTSEKREHPPKLYDLTTLQREANRLLGFSAQQTLDYAQSLYEKKLLTYPRTDSRFLTSDMEDSTEKVIRNIILYLPKKLSADYHKNIQQILNDKKVSDHHAIIPTESFTLQDLNQIPQGEKDLLEMLLIRLMAAIGEAFSYTETTVSLTCNNHTFTAKGKLIKEYGWKALDDYYKSSLKVKKSSQKQEIILPKLNIGQEFTQLRPELEEGRTSPPKHFTEDTLLSAMETAGIEDLPEDIERKGLGTSATRAGIIEKLIRTGFVERKGNKKLKTLHPTHKGIALVTILPEEIKSAQMTSEWEEKLQLMEKRQLSSIAFMTGIEDLVKNLTATYKGVTESPIELPVNPNPLGQCPRCQDNIFEGDKRYFCQNKDCQFSLWKDNRFFTSKKKKLTRALVASFLQNGWIEMDDLFSPKTQKTYAAKILMEDTGGKYVNFRLKFTNDNKKEGKEKDECKKSNQEPDRC